MTTVTTPETFVVARTQFAWRSPALVKEITNQFTKEPYFVLGGNALVRAYQFPTYDAAESCVNKMKEAWKQSSSDELHIIPVSQYDPGKDYHSFK